MMTLSVLTGIEFLDLGLSIWYKPHQIEAIRKEKGKVKKFKRYYGCPPLVAAALWEDLQRTDIEEALFDSLMFGRMPPDKADSPWSPIIKNGPIRDAVIALRPL